MKYKEEYKLVHLLYGAFLFDRTSSTALACGRDHFEVIRLLAGERSRENIERDPKLEGVCGRELFCMFGVQDN